VASVIASTTSDRSFIKSWLIAKSEQARATTAVGVFMLSYVYHQGFCRTFWKYRKPQVSLGLLLSEYWAELVVRLKYKKNRQCSHGTYTTCPPCESMRVSVLALRLASIVREWHNVPLGFSQAQLALAIALNRLSNSSRRI